MWPRRSPIRSDNWISVIFHPDKMEVAEVEQRVDGNPRVVAWDAFACTAEEAPTALKRLRPRLGGHCTTLLGTGQYQVVQIDAPDLPADAAPDEKRQAVRWRIKEMVDFPVEAAGIDVLDIPASRGGGRAAQVFAVAASHKALSPLVQLFQDAKVPLKAIDIPEMAQRNIAAIFEDENRGLALLAFDDEGGRLTFSFGGELYALRRIDVRRKDFVGPDSELPMVYEKVLLDVQRSLDNFDRNFSSISLNRLLVAPMPGVQAFIDYLKGNLYQPVELLDLATRIDLTAVPALAEPQAQSDAFMAIGAALREEAAA